MKYYIKTYGCQMNEYDSERVSTIFEDLGYSKSEAYQDADLVLINTCSIREKADHKLYSELGRINEFKVKMQTEGKYQVIVVSGCVPETAKDEIFIRAPFVDIIIGPQSYLKLKDMIKIVSESVELDKKTGFARAAKKHLQHLEFSTTDKFDFLAEERKSFNGVSAFVSVHEGCNKFCTFCVVPNTRGRQVSRTSRDIIREIYKVAELGAKEVVLLGQNVTAFKEEIDGRIFTLTDLINEASKIESIERIRYTTSHPIDMKQDIVDAFNNRKLMPYLHLPVQSGADDVLRRMNRKYTRDFYMQLVEKFRQVRPDLVLSSDFIVGFPGETDRDFEDTLDLIRKVKYQAQCYSFAYSKRPGTVAANMPDQVDPKIQKERLAILQKLLEDQKNEFNESCENKVLDVLFEETKTKTNTQAGGRSQYGQIILVDCKSEEEKQSLIGTIRQVKITKVGRNSLFGRLASFIFYFLFTFVYFINCEALNFKTKSIEAQKAVNLIQNQDYTLIDISNKNKNSTETIRNALMIPKENLIVDFKKYKSILDNKKIIIYSADCEENQEVAKKLSDLTKNDVFYIEKNLNQLKQENLPIIQKKRLLITGGAGFIGSNLAAKLQNKYEVTVLDNLYAGKLSNIKDLNVKFVNGDIRDIETVDKLVAQNDYVVHLAASVSVPKSIEDPYFSQSINIGGFLNIIQACKKFNVKKLVYASSAAVYGDNDNLPLKESENFKPLSPYGLEKSVDEQYANLYKDFVESIGLRFFNVYGKNQDPSSPYSGVISIFVNAFKSNKTIKIFGDGLQSRDLVNVKDVCDGIEDSLNSSYSGVLNICTSKATNLLQIVETLEYVSGKKQKIILEKERKGDIRHSFCDNKKAKDKIGFFAKVDIKTGLNDLYNIQ